MSASQATRTALSRSSFPSLCLLFLALFGALGMEVPFFPAFLASRGLSSNELSLVLLVGSITRIGLAPASGLLADRVGIRLVLACSAVAAGISLLLNLGATTLAGFAGAALISSAALAPINPLCDALAARVSRQEGGYTFGGVRGFGSLGFLLATLAGSEIITYAGLPYTLIASAILFLVMAPVVMGVAPIKCGVAGPVVWRESVALMCQRNFVLLLIVSALILGSHVMNNTFSFILWTGKGMTTRTAGVLWAESVFVEVVVFFAVAPRLIGYFGTRGCAILAAGAGIIRWAILASTVSLAPLVTAQALHGLTFALMVNTAVSAISAYVPIRLTGSAQTIFAAVTFSVVNVILTPISGEVYTLYGAHAYWLMSLLCVAALIVSFALPREPVVEE